MSGLIVRTAAEQVAAHLEGELRRGVWTGQMPGGDRLAAELGVGRDTVEAALRRLEEEGLLVNQGRRRGRRIELAASRSGLRRLRVGILLDEADSLKVDYVVELVHGLAGAGHLVFHPPRTMSELGLDVARIAAMVEKTEADAWLVLAGSREILEWFGARDVPAFAVFGRRRGLAMAGVGPDKPHAIAEITRTLIALGHRRIVLLARPRRRLPEPGASELAFFRELDRHGITPGAYHLPDWEESIDGFQTCLKSLFRTTPPTALIIDEAPFFVAALQFLGSKGVRVPQDVSLVCTDANPAFAWCRPSVAHIHWESRPVVRRIMNWVANVSSGKKDKRQTETPAEFVPGGTIGRANE